MNNVILKIAVPEIWPIITYMRVPHAPFEEALQYELEECVRRESFWRRFGVTLEDAISDVDASMTAARMAADDAPASAGTVSETRCVEARG